jgi:hypothetical protein
MEEAPLFKAEPQNFPVDRDEGEGYIRAFSIRQAICDIFDSLIRKLMRGGGTLLLQASIFYDE